MKQITTSMQTSSSIMFDNYHQDSSLVSISGCTFEASTANANGGVLFLAA